MTWQGRPIAMALVTAYPKPVRDLTTAPAAEVPSSETGEFTLELPSGSYWLWARATVSSPTAKRTQRLVGRFADNPVLVAGGELHAAIRLEDATGFTAAAGPAGAGVRGSVAGAAPGEITVYVYAGHRERPQGPGFLAAVTPAGDGAFSVDLGPGRYTLAARWRTSGAEFGGLQPGDRVAVYQALVPVGGYQEIGRLELRPVDPAVWQQVSDDPSRTTTQIIGRVLDPQGNPMPGIHVLAFDDPRMAGKPLALSHVSGQDGAFRVSLPGPGVYYLGARSRIGGPAEPGEWSGTLRGPNGAGLPVKTGETVEGVVIPVEEVW